MNYRLEPIERAVRLLLGVQIAAVGLMLQHRSAPASDGMLAMAGVLFATALAGVRPLALAAVLFRSSVARACAPGSQTTAFRRFLCQALRAPGRAEG